MHAIAGSWQGELVIKKTSWTRRAASPSWLDGMPAGGCVRYLLALRGAEVLMPSEGRRRPLRFRKRTRGVPVRSRFERGILMSIRLRYHQSSKTIESGFSTPSVERESVQRMNGMSLCLGHVRLPRQDPPWLVSGLLVLGRVCSQFFACSEATHTLPSTSVGPPTPGTHSTLYQGPGDFRGDKTDGCFPPAHPTCQSGRAETLTRVSRPIPFPGSRNAHG